MSHQGLRRGVAVAGASAMLSGCAFSDGDAFGLVEASLEAEHVRLEDRVREGGFEATSSDFEVRLDELTLEIDSLSLVLRALEGESSTFDPQNPPEGYSLCHNGHCHRDDGALVDYATIEAELSSGGAEGGALVLGGGTSDVLSGAPLALPCGDESRCVVGEGRVSLLELRVHGLNVSGEVRDGRSGDLARFEGVRAFDGVIDLLHDGEGEEPSGARRLPADVPFSDDDPPRVRLVLHLTATAALLDGVDFAALAEVDPSPTLVLDEPTAERIVENFGELDLGLSVERTND